MSIVVVIDSWPRRVWMFGNGRQSATRRACAASRGCADVDTTTICATRGATLALEAGVHPKVVQQQVGHANISITLDIYSHASPAMQSDAAERVSKLIAGNES